MADLDPDVDAIYRLTQKLGVTFEKDIASVVLPEGVMCPWNSQNTLFEREALWGLLIPVTTTFRVCDIWRSYWVQVRRSRPCLNAFRSISTVTPSTCMIPSPSPLFAAAMALDPPAGHMPGCTCRFTFASRS